MSKPSDLTTHQNQPNIGTTSHHPSVASHNIANNRHSVTRHNHTIAQTPTHPTVNHHSNPKKRILPETPSRQRCNLQLHIAAHSRSSSYRTARRPTMSGYERPAQLCYLPLSCSCIANPCLSCLHVITTAIDC